MPGVEAKIGMSAQERRPRRDGLRAVIPAKAGIQ